MEPVPELQTVTSSEISQPKRIAPLWHTILLIVVIAGFSLAGANSEHKLSATNSGLTLQYILTMAFEWVLVLYVIWGIRRTKAVTVREVIGGRWAKVEDFLLDIGIGFGFWLVAALVLAALGLAMGMGGAENLKEAQKQLGFLVPRTPLQITLWFGVSATAGFCEEFLFRGYVQRQFTVVSGQVAVGMIVSAVVFGLAHGYEGPKRMLLISVFGLMFSLLTHFRRSTRPGMIAHAWHDTFTGLALRTILK